MIQNSEGPARSVGTDGKSKVESISLLDDPNISGGVFYFGGFSDAPFRWMVIAGWLTGVCYRCTRYCAEVS